MKNNNKAFTLVELIVVITILAVLGTIAFIALQDYASEARDSKRIQNVKSLLSKIHIEVGKGISLDELITSGSGENTRGEETTQINTHNAIINNSGAIVNQGAINFLAIKENRENFMDLNNRQDYPFSYSEGGSGTGAYKFIQIASISEENNWATVQGNYYKMDPLNDSEGLISINSSSSAASDVITNKGTLYPYDIY